MVKPGVYELEDGRWLGLYFQAKPTLFATSGEAEAWCMIRQKLDSFMNTPISSEQWRAWSHYVLAALTDNQIPVPRDAT